MECRIVGCVALSLLAVVLVFVLPTTHLPRKKVLLDTNSDLPTELATTSPVVHVTSQAPTPPPTRPAATYRGPYHDVVDAKGAWARIESVPSGCVVLPNPAAFSLHCARTVVTANKVLRATLAVHPSVALSADRVVPFCTLGCTSATVLGDATLVTDSTDPQQFEVELVLEGGGICSVTYGTECTITFDMKLQFRPPSNWRHIDGEVIKRRGRLPPVCFASLGDWGSAQPDMLKVSRQLRNFSHVHFIKFILSTGDNFYPVGVKSVRDPQFQRTFEIPYADPLVKNIRWYICAGNHDQWGWPAQVLYTNISPRWYFPSLTYFDDIPIQGHHVVRLVALNSYGRDLNVQLDSLARYFNSSQHTSTPRKVVRVGEAVGNHTNKSAVSSPPPSQSKNGAPSKWPIKKWRFVLNHSPVFSGSMHGSSGHSKNLIAVLKPLLESYHVHGYFSGDDHILEVSRSNSVDYFVSGAGGGSHRYQSQVLEGITQWSLKDLGPQRMKKGIVGFMMHCWERDASQLVTRLIDEEGQVLYQYTTKYN